MTFTVLAKINSMKCFCNTKVAGVGKFFSYENFQLCSISRVVLFFFISLQGCSLVPRPHPLRGKRGLVNLDTILGPGKGI